MNIVARNVFTEPENPNHVRIGKPVPFEWVGYRWYVATLRTGHDRRAREALETAEIPCFMMEERRLCRTRSQGRVLRDRPLLPGYLFIGDLTRFTNFRFDRLDSNPFSGMVGFGEGPQRVNGAKMQELFVLHESGQFVPRSKRDALQRRFEIGQDVRVLDGPMASFDATINKFKSGDRVEILVDIFGRQSPVIVGLDSLEEIDP